MDRDAGEISELAQNRLAIGVGYSANACGGDAVTTGAAGRATRSTVSAVVIRRDQSLGMGQNYIRSLLALGFQAFLIIVCVAIYAVLVQNIALVDDIIYAIWTCMGYTVLLCFCLFKTSSLAKSVFNAH